MCCENRWAIRAFAILLSAGLLGSGVDVQAGPEDGSQAEDDPLGSIQNDESPFFVQVSVDSPDCTYYDGQEMRIRVNSSREGFLYLFYRNARGETHCVFPNRYQKNQRIPANTPVWIPAADADYCFQVVPPFGTELLKAIMTDRSLPPEQLPAELLTTLPATPVDKPVLKDISVTLRRRPPLEWGAGEIAVTTRPKKSEPPPEQTTPTPKRRRVVLIVAIAHYERGPEIPTLEAVAHDAQIVKAMFEAVGSVDLIEVLVDQAATRAAVREAICGWLPKVTQPGDDIIIYWSGHCGKIADDDGDEHDGFDEYLLPFDADRSSMETIHHTMITDDVMGHWLQTLHGRTVGIIVDACYGQGLASSAKGDDRPEPFDFLDTEVAAIAKLGVKDVDAQSIAVLAAAAEDEQAFEMQTKQASVMTHFLVEFVEQAKPATLKDVYGYVAEHVPPYVQEHKGVKQTPLLCGQQAAERVVLRP